MKFLLLVTIITWSFGGGYQNPPHLKIVDSPESAAMIIMDNHLYTRNQVEPDHKRYELYEVDLDKGTIKQVAIPKIKFETENQTESLLK